MTDVRGARRSRTRARRFPVVLLALAAMAIASSGVVVACVIAPPPGELPVLPEYRATIVRETVVPPPSVVLTRLPTEFAIPVERIDPSKSYDWRVFVDYTGDRIAASKSGSLSASENRVESVLVETPEIPDDPVFKVCHTIEFVIAREFQRDTVRTPGPLGADSVSWFYDPTGDASGCAAYVAGPDAGAVDAAGPSDASREAE